MLDTYREILAKPGATAFASSGLLARLPMSMFNISMILMVQIQYDSYQMAGRVAAIGTLVWALQTVPTSRLVDRVGQRAAMIPLSCIFVVGVSLAIWTAMTHGPALRCLRVAQRASGFAHARAVVGDAALGPGDSHRLCA